MADTTPTYGFPYQELGDAPDGPALGKDLAEAVEGEFERIDLGYSVHIRTTAGTANFVKPSNPPARFHWVRLWGGGGAGGGTVGAASGLSEGAGGGSGGYVEKWYADSDLSSSESYTVGAGGTASSGSAGGNGGDSTFKSLSAGGGEGGNAMTSTTGNAGAVPGAGGSVSGGDLVCSGSYGGFGNVIGGRPVFANFGGAAPSGGGIAHQTDNGAGVGSAGKSPGGGGSGSFSSSSSFAGGAGAAGKILIISFY